MKSSLFLSDRYFLMTEMEFLERGRFNAVFFVFFILTRTSFSKGRKHEASNPLPDWEAVREVRFPPPIFSMRPLVFQKEVFYLSWVILHNAKKYIHTYNSCYSIKCFSWSQILSQYFQWIIEKWQLILVLCKSEHKNIQKRVEQKKH